jgi:hypothetical protein
MFGSTTPSFTSGLVGLCCANHWANACLCRGRVGDLVRLVAAALEVHAAGQVDRGRASAPAGSSASALPAAPRIFET